LAFDLADFFLLLTEGALRLDDNVDFLLDEEDNVFFELLVVLDFEPVNTVTDHMHKI